MAWHGPCSGTEAWILPGYHRTLSREPDCHEPKANEAQNSREMRWLRWETNF